MLLDWLTGTRSPAPGVTPAPPAAVRAALLAVNRPTAPFLVRPATADDELGADLAAEWRMADPTWYAVFAPVRMMQLRVSMRFVPGRHEVRAIDRLFDVEWTAFPPTITASVRRGQVYEASFGVPPFIETTAAGRQIRFRFSTSELKDPLREAVTAQGWTWRGAVRSL